MKSKINKNNLQTFIDLNNGIEPKEEKKFKTLILNPNKVTNTDCPICGGSGGDVCQQCTGIILRFVVSSIPIKTKPVESELEKTLSTGKTEIEKIKIPIVLLHPKLNDITDFLACDIVPTLNKIIDYLSEDKVKKEGK